MIGGIIDAVVGAATNVRDYKRSVNQYNQQYSLQKEQFYKPMQVRVADLKKAGLHPTLAAGMTSGQVVSNPSSSLPQQPNTNIAGVLQSKKLSNELLTAQIDNVRAQTADIRANTPIPGQSTTIHDAQAQGTKNIIERPPNTDRPKEQKGSQGTLQIAKDIVVKLTEGVPVEAIENEYGELVSLPYGIIRAIKDLGFNINDYRKYGIRTYDALNRNLKMPRGRGMLNR